MKVKEVKKLMKNVPDNYDFKLATREAGKKFFELYGFSLVNLKEWNNKIINPETENDTLILYPDTFDTLRI